MKGCHVFIIILLPVLVVKGGAVHGVGKLNRTQPPRFESILTYRNGSFRRGWPIAVRRSSWV